MCNGPLLAWVSSIGLAMAVFVLPGCTADFWTEPEPAPSDNGSTLDPEVVLVRFINLTIAQGVDVEFYVAQEALENLPEDLFVDEHLASAGIGFVGLGIIEPNSFETIELTCADNLTLGTRGGTFLDSDTGEELGNGTMRWVQEGQLGLCGATVTFSFAVVEEGFTTTLRVTDKDEG